MFSKFEWYNSRRLNEENTSTIQRILGHTSPSTTECYYLEPTQQGARNVMSVFARRLSADRNTNFVSQKKISTKTSWKPVRGNVITGCLDLKFYTSLISAET